MNTSRVILRASKVYRSSTLKKTPVAIKSKLPNENISISAAQSNKYSTVVNISINNVKPVYEDTKLDINIKGLKHGLITFNHDLAWYHFERLKQGEKLHLCSIVELSELLKSIKYPDHGRADAIKVKEKLSIITNTIKSLGMELDESDYRHLLATYGFLKMERKVYETWKELVQVSEIPSIYSINALCYTYLTLKKPSKVINLYNEIKNLQIREDGQLYLLVMQAYAQLKDGANVIIYFEKYLDFSRDTMRDPDLNLGKVSKHAYRKFFSALQVCGVEFVPKVEEYFNKMIADDVTPQEIHFQIIMDMHLRNGLNNEAVTWFIKMPSFEIEPRMDNYVEYLINYKETGFIEKFCSQLEQSQLYSLIAHLQTKLSVTKYPKVRGKLDTIIDRVERFKD